MTKERTKEEEGGGRAVRLEVTDEAPLHIQVRGRQSN